MTENTQCFGDDFEAHTLAEWKARVEQDLGGASFDKRLKTRTPEGIVVEPLYAAPRGGSATGPHERPGIAPFTRASHPLGRSRAGWEIRLDLGFAGPDRAKEALERGLARGAHAVALSPRALGVSTRDDLSRLFESVDLAGTPIVLNAASQTLGAAALLFTLAEQRGVDWKELRGELGDDPLGQLAETGSLEEGLARRFELLGSLAAWTRVHAAGLRSVRVSGLPYAEGGASAVQEIACALATGAQYLRVMEAGGLEPGVAAQQMAFTLGIGRDLFMEVAKVRAMRRTWSRLVDACGGDQEGQRLELSLHSLERRRSQRDPWVNMLRATVESFIVAASGASSATIAPFDAVLGESDAFALRMARNTQIMLRDESQLHRVVDPAGGSWYLESLTEELALRGWEHFQSIEEAGGMAVALGSGRIAREIAATAAEQRREIARRTRPLTGVSSYPNLEERPVVRNARQAAGRAVRQPAMSEASPPERTLPDALATASGEALVATVIEAARQGASLGVLHQALAGDASPSRGPAIVAEREAAPFEALRDASDAAAERPRVLLATLGSIAQHKTRAMFAANLLAAGGIAASGGEGPLELDELGGALDRSGASLAVICSSDLVYQTQAAAAAQRLKAAGAKGVYLAGRPGALEETLRQAGVDDFLFLGCDVHHVLTKLLERIEVIR